MPNCVVCSVVCDKSCGHCKKVWYCSVDHQRSHRREHKEECFPAIEKESKDKGRFFVASRDIKPLEVLWIDKPIMIAPDSTLPRLYPMCLGCCKILAQTFHYDFSTCSSCEWPLCGPSCEDIKWHSEFECAVFKANNLKPWDVTFTLKFYENIKILRLLLVKRTDPKKWNKIISLKSHVHLLRKQPNFETTAFLLADFIRNRCKIDEEQDLLENLFGICSRNSGQACSADILISGKRHMSLMYEKRGKMLYSCKTNTVTVCEKAWKNQRTYATVEIKKGEDVFDYFRYDETRLEFPGHVERRIELFEAYQFWCRCSMCKDPTEEGTFYSAIRCNKKKGGKVCSGYLLPCIVTNPGSPFQVSRGKWRCNFPNCKNEEKYSRLSNIVETIGTEIDAVGQFGGIKEKLDIIAKYENVEVHENHFLLTKLRFGLLPSMLQELQVTVARHGRNEEECLKATDQLKAFAEKCLTIADKFHPGLNLLRGVILFIIVAQNKLRLKYKIANARMDPEMDKLHDEAVLILGLMNEGSIGHILYTQLQSDPSDFVFINAANDFMLGG